MDDHKTQTPITDQMRATGGWNPNWDPFAELDPVWTEKFMDMGVTPLARGVLDAKTWELIAIAVDAAQRRRQPYDGAVALGCVIRGETIHFEIVSHQSARGLVELSIARGLPIGNGIITVEDEAQAFARARMDEQDKGGDAARAVLSLIALKRKLAGRPARQKK